MNFNLLISERSKNYCFHEFSNNGQYSFSNGIKKKLYMVYNIKNYFYK